MNPGFTGGNVEYSLDGNYCRCTGYRSIMDAFKSLSKSTSENCNMKVQDIEVIHWVKITDDYVLIALILLLM